VCHAKQAVDIVAPLLHGPRGGRGARGWRSNSLATDSAPGAALDVLDICAGVCYRAECIAAATPGGEIGGPRCGRGSRLFHHEVLRQEIMVLDDVDHGVEQKNKQKPKA
jgi:hypothetical protein